MLIATDDYIKGVLKVLLENPMAVKMVLVDDANNKVFWQMPECRVTIHVMMPQKELERKAKNACVHGV